MGLVDEQAIRRAQQNLRDIGRLKPFSRGDVLMTSGKPSDEVLLVESGMVKVVLAAQNGSESILGMHGTGELIGEMGVMSGRPRSATVIAHVTGSATHIPANAFLRLLDRDRETMLMLQDTLERRLRMADHRTLAFASHDVPTRVGAQLLEWSQTCGERTRDGVVIRGLTQLDLAQTVAASLKSVEAALDDLRRLKLVETGRVRFRLPDPDLLEKVISKPGWRPK